MVVQPLINVDSNRLCGIFWMTASQILLWSRDSDVILHDNTSRTNKYNYPLSLFILVDGDGKPRLGAQAFLNDETQESYEWILQQTLDATGIEPQVIMTDMDLAMDAACHVVYKMHIMYSTCHKFYQRGLDQSLEIQITNPLYMTFGKHETHYVLMFLNNNFNLY